MEGGEYIFENCPFSTVGKNDRGLVKQVEGTEFVIFASEDMQRLKVSCNDRDNSIDYRVLNNDYLATTDFNLKSQGLYHLVLPEKCTADMGQYYLTPSHSINEGTYQTVNFDYIMNRNGTSISDVLKGFGRDEVRTAGKFFRCAPT